MLDNDNERIREACMPRWKLLTSELAAEWTSLFIICRNAEGLQRVGYKWSVMRTNDKSKMGKMGFNFHRLRDVGMGSVKI